VFVASVLPLFRPVPVLRFIFHVFWVQRAGDSWSRSGADGALSSIVFPGFFPSFRPLAPSTVLFLGLMEILYPGDEQVFEGSSWACWLVPMPGCFYDPERILSFT